MPKNKNPRCFQPRDNIRYFVLLPASVLCSDNYVTSVLDANSFAFIFLHYEMMMPATFDWKTIAERPILLNVNCSLYEDLGSRAKLRTC